MQSTSVPPATKKWSAVFYWVHYDDSNLPSLAWPFSKYILFTKGINIRGHPQIIGYVQFLRPMALEDLQPLNEDIYWTYQKASNTAAIAYIHKCNTELQGQLIELGEHYPIRQRLQTVAETPTYQLYRRPREGSYVDEETKPIPIFRPASPLVSPSPTPDVAEPK